ncbi:DUF4386 domain-containing protein [Taibaiella chishuiensis]|uniref:Uncharacterized protein DUF4386 n=1 Tax=Taibaiella chishuiensis TaxID=1434707 RepID=A0A2P8D1E2_9BACT|nr:DUF4386 domain-containing protein [Taibaiella chishuiensis]PSK91050.1 uncharacterized protein DUF4386 [Taibaiella chishuiensis]
MSMYTTTKLAGLLMLAGLAAGLCSVAPEIDMPGYLTEAGKAPGRVIRAVVCQFILSLTYMGVAVLLYPQLARFGGSLSVGFLGFRIVAVVLSVMGTVLLLALLALSKAYLQYPWPALAVTGDILKVVRDQLNHVFMVLTLCIGNVMLYVLLLRSGLVPSWLPVWGIVAAFLSMIASLLFLGQYTGIATPLYLALNVPAALLELVLGLWLICMRVGGIVKTIDGP